MAMRDIMLSGHQQLQRRLARLSGATQRRIVRRPLASGLSVISKAAKQRVPVRYGFLKKSIGTRVRLYRGGVWGGVGPRVGQAYVYYDREGRRHVPGNYAHLVEYGTRGATAHPFLRPALDANRARALGVLAAGIKKNLEKEAAKK